MSASHPEIWRGGSSYVEGFINPQHELVYICNKSTAGDTGFVVLSIENLAEIIAAHQKRSREYRRDHTV